MGLGLISSEGPEGTVGDSLMIVVRVNFGTDHCWGLIVALKVRGPWKEKIPWWWWRACPDCWYSWRGGQRPWWARLFCAWRWQTPWDAGQRRRPRWTDVQLRPMHLRNDRPVVAKSIEKPQWNTIEADKARDFPLWIRFFIELQSQNRLYPSNAVLDFTRFAPMFYYPSSIRF